MKKIFIACFLFLILSFSIFWLIDTNFNTKPESVDSTQSSIDAPNIPVLMYHILLDGQNDSISVDPNRFKEQMLAIDEAGYTTITEYELVDHLQNNAKLPDKPILLTFDDGYKSVYTEAFPVLEQLGMKATVYVIGSRMFDTPTDLYSDEHEKITWADAKSMENTFLVQGHTWDSHRQQENFFGKPKGLISGRLTEGFKIEKQEEFEKRVLEDLLLSKQSIEEKMGYEVVSLAYPYGDYSQDTIKLVKQAGYKIAFTINAGVVNRNTAKAYELNRITADGSYSGEELLTVIENAN